MTKVIIIGAGCAGPVLAMLLKKKGFEPVLYERTAALPGGGLALQLSGQVFKVLDILGLAEEALAISLPMESSLLVSQYTGNVLMDTDVQSKIRESTGWPIAGIIRKTCTEFLIQKTEERGIPLHWSKRLVDVKQDGKKVTAIFEDGMTDEGDILVGCDGIHSKVRDSLFGKTPVEFTGLASIGGFTPFSDTVHPTGPNAVNQVASIGAHMVYYPTVEGKYFWTVNIGQEAELLEDWRSAPKAELADMLPFLPPIHWDGPAGEIIRNSEGVVRFRLYLREIPPIWHKGRAVLVGDAAHPTMPFLGQGVNQSTEDIYHLVRLLVKHEPESLERTFAEYTAVRLPPVTKRSSRRRGKGSQGLRNLKRRSWRARRCSRRGSTTILGRSSRR